MPTYNPLDSRFLTTANAITRDGQKFVRIILDIQDNVFYTLDDDGNFNPIGSGGTSSSGVTSINVGTGLSANSTTGAVTITYTGSTGNTYTSTNGITQNPANNFKLGGSLSENTTISGNSNNLTITGLTDLKYQTFTYNHTNNNSTSVSQLIMSLGANQLVQLDTSAQVQSQLNLYNGNAELLSTSVATLLKINIDAQQNRIDLVTPRVATSVAEAGDVLTLISPTTGEMEFQKKIKCYGAFVGDPFTDGGVQGDWYIYDSVWQDGAIPNINIQGGTKLQTLNIDNENIILMFVVAGEVEAPTSESIELAWSINDTSAPNIIGSRQMVHTLNAGDPIATFTQTFMVRTEGQSDQFSLFFKNITDSTSVTIRNINLTIHRVD